MDPADASSSSQKQEQLENNEYFQKLKQNDLYISPDIEKKEIKGIFIPKDSTSDRLIKKWLLLMKLKCNLKIYF